MDATPRTISLHDFRALCATFPPPQILDVRRAAAFDRDRTLIPGAVRCPPEEVDTLLATLEPWRPVVAVCVHGHEVSQNAAALLASHGYDARSLEGGHDQWRADGGATVPWQPPTQWVTRERPKIDRIACPWLVQRFIDPAAEFFYVPAAEVRGFADVHGATPFDIPGVQYGHDEERCSFDAFIRIHGIADGALDRLATIVRGADTGVPSLAAESPGLLATSQGLSAMFADDHAMLRAGMMMYDALYLWCRERVHAARFKAA